MLARSTEPERLLWVRAALAPTGGRSSAYALPALRLVGSPAHGKLVFTLCNTADLQNFLGSLPSGAVASAVDVATSLALASTLISTVCAAAACELHARAAKGCARAARAAGRRSITLASRSAIECCRSAQS